ncbi:MAG TPA: hypothetical protein VKA46_28015 [Gemmataceae bacterium]|nr:hypothetical protein [Gemmataceae bacterium]
MSERSEQLQSILVAYIEAAEMGQEPRRDELLARHPEFAAELTEFLDGRERIQRVAPPAASRSPEMPTLAPGEQPTAPLGTLRYFGDYELLEEIARGGMGVVYRARQVSLNRIVALKMILSGQLAGAEDVRRFQTEAEAAANLDHPSIVPIYEADGTQGQQHHHRTDHQPQLLHEHSLHHSLHEQNGRGGPYHLTGRDQRPGGARRW